MVTTMNTKLSLAQRGMTLIEILVVLVLIGIVMGILGGNFIGRGEKAKADAARIEIGQIGQALDLYKLETGRYPSSSEGLQALIAQPAGATNWNGPYWKKSTIPKDPWGNDYRYTVARPEGRLRHPLARRRRQGRRRGDEQGHHERGLTPRRRSA
jgi:general secretion pathway protein G